MEFQKKYITHLNADDEPNMLTEQEALNVVNLRHASSDDGFSGRWEIVPSNQEIVNPYRSTADITIGQVSDEANRYIVFFNYNATGTHGIYLFYQPTQTYYKVLTGAILSFDKYHLVKAGIINNILYWTDGYNEPCRINLAAAIKFNHGGVSPLASDWQFNSITDVYDYTVIRRPPCLTGSVTKTTDSFFPNNFIANISVQFAYQYVYWDGELSVLSAYTTASKLNAPTDSYNALAVTLSNQEVIPDSVRAVRLIAIYSPTDGGKAFTVKTWDKKKSATDITNHNSGTAALSYTFYNDIIGESIDDPTVALPYHTVPNLSRTLELGKNRLFLANNMSGYDTPATTSLAVSTGTIAGGATTISKNWEQIDVIGISQNQQLNWVHSSWMVNITEYTPYGWYEYTPSVQIVQGTGVSIPVLTAPPTSVSKSGLTFRGATLFDVQNAVKPANPSFYNVVAFQTQEHLGQGNNVFSVTGITSQAISIFKSKSSYLLGVVFYDKAMRKCGVVSNGAKVTTPPRDFALTSGVSQIKWALSNTAATTEIPSWAYYYSVVMTRNLRTRFFMQALSDKVRYAIRQNGLYVQDLQDAVFGVNTVGIAIDLTALQQANLGYVFNEGDMCLLIDDGNAYISELPILAVQDNLLILSPKSLGGSLSGRKFVYEIYTPYKATSQEPYYEMGEILPITAAGTSARTYSKLSGAISSDTFMISRNYTVAYFVEAMCANDKFYKRWDTDHGRINLITLEGQKTQPTSIMFSATYVQGTQTNGLSDFEPLNADLLDVAMGPLQALCLTSKVEGEGNVLLAIGTSQVASIYIGETMVTNQDSTSYFVKSTGVLSQINILKGDYGTLNPESVVAFKGDVFWFSTASGKFVQYSINGVDDISEGKDSTFKFARVSRQLAKKYLATSIAAMETFGSRPFVFGGVDPRHREIYWTFPKMDASVPKGGLIDYATNPPAWIDNADYPYDPLDYKGKTFVYKLGQAKWSGTYLWKPEGFSCLLDDTYSLKDGKLYQHNIPGSYGTFYGVSYRGQVMIPCNKDNTIKEFRTMAVESSTAPEWVHFRTEYPSVQSSDLLASDFVEKEGVWYADILRDRLTPAPGGYDLLQMTGDTMRGKVLYFLIQFNSNTLTWFRMATIGYNLSSGHY